MNSCSEHRITYCTQCGLCCKLFHVLPPGLDIVSILDRGDGICRYLVDNKCSIYENRPLICNSAKMYDLYFMEQFTWEDFQNHLKQQCQELKRRYHIKDEGSC